MKVYKCDVCGNTLDPDYSMIDGRYEHKRKVEWINPDGKKDVLHVEKTLTVHKMSPPVGDKLSSTRVKVSIDVCRGCLKRFEKP
jgi:hypothetical protein